MPTTTYVIPPAGISAASGFTPATFADPASPPALLADYIDPATGELLSLFTYVHPVDAMVVEAFRLERGTGAAIQNDGHAFSAIKKVTEATPRQLEDEARRILKPLVDRGDIKIGTLQTEVGIDATDLGAVFIEYTNLHTGKGQPVRIR